MAEKLNQIDHDATLMCGQFLVTHFGINKLSHSQLNHLDQIFVLFHVILYNTSCLDITIFT